MAKIQTVDYEKIPTYAKNMRSHGKSLNSEMTNAYQSIADMHSSWYGKRYNELVKQFNKMVSTINEMLQLVVTDIPSTLETVANNYSQADKGSNATTVSTEAPKKITNLTVPNDVGMKFISSNVSSVQTKVASNFTKAKTDMSNIQTELNKVTWTSEAATAFNSKFKTLKSQIDTLLDDTNKQFKQLMQQAQTDIETAEKNNTVS